MLVINKIVYNLRFQNLTEFWMTMKPTIMKTEEGGQGILQIVFQKNPAHNISLVVVSFYTGVWKLQEKKEIGNIQEDSSDL